LAQDATCAELRKARAKEAAVKYKVYIALLQRLAPVALELRSPCACVTLVMRSQAGSVIEVPAGSISGAL
jgi:hypothetical protein